MGNELATPGAQYSIGKQTLASSSSSETVGVPGKATLTEALESSPSADVARVARRAGARFVDKGKFEWVVLPDGSFECTKAPGPVGAGKRSAGEGKRITIESMPGVWGVLHDLLLAQTSEAKPAKAAAPPVDAARAARAARAVLSPAELEANDKRVRKDTKPTLEGSTLEIAQTRAARGNADTHYRRSEKVDDDVRKAWSGDPNANTFWCSSFSMWTLAAAGYNLDSELVGSDGKPFTYATITKATGLNAAKKVERGRTPELMKEVVAAGLELAADEYPLVRTIKFRELIDGHALPVKATSRVEADPQSPGRFLGVYREPTNGYEGLIDGPNNTALAAMGAPGAFEAFGIGRVIPEVEQKPGDFGQERWPVRGVHDGHGHAFQVWSVIAEGNALFGKKGSPEPIDDEKADGWKEGVTFRITKDTKPSLVGEHTVRKASRIEANEEQMFPAQPKDAKADAKTPAAPKGDGGVLITGERPVPDPNRGHAGCVVFIGRLGSSPWSQWTKATKPSL